MIKNIIFDLDGTLINSHKDIINAFNHAFKKNYIKTKVNLNFFKINANLGSKYFIKNAAEQQKHDSKKIQNDFLKYYNSNFYKNTTLKKGVLEFLDYSKSMNYINILCTNKNEKTAIKILKKYNIYKYFNFIVGFDTFTEKKPQLKLIRKMKKKFKLKSSQTLVIGDTEIDSILAKRGKMKFYLIQNGYTIKKSIPNNFSFKDYFILKKKITNEQK
jgi:phosphoglycolate phosphatase